jgi:hypothetical protein
MDLILGTQKVVILLSVEQKTCTCMFQCKTELMKDVFGWAQKDCTWRIECAVFLCLPKTSFDEWVLHQNMQIGFFALN